MFAYQSKLQYKYIKEKTKTIKSLTRKLIGKNWPKAIFSTVLAYYIFAAPGYLASYFNLSDKFYYPLIVWDIVVGGLMLTGLAKLFLNLVDGKPASVKDLFAGIKCFKASVLIGLFLYGILYFMGYGLIFSVLMVILLLANILSIFVLMDDPNKRAFQCLAESRLLMRVNKGKLFKLFISFIGWIFLSLCIGVLVEVLALGPTLFGSLVTADVSDATAYANQLEIITTELSNRLGIGVYLLGLPTVVVGSYIFGSLATFYQMATDKIYFASEKEAEKYKDVYTAEEAAGDSPFKEEPTVVDVDPINAEDKKDSDQ